MAEVDVLDEQAVDQHLPSVLEKPGRIDISFNAAGTANTTLLGVPLLELDAEQFSIPIATYTRSYFLTARLAARYIIPKKSGVIMTHGHCPPLANGQSAAWADTALRKRPKRGSRAPCRAN